MAERPVLTVEEAIAQADAIPPVPSDEDFARLSLVDKLEVGRQASDRGDLRRAVLAGHLHAHTPPLYVSDARCGTSFTVVGYLAHSAQVQHQAGEVVPTPVEVDERDRGRGGESKTAVLS